MFFAKIDEIDVPDALPHSSGGRWSVVARGVGVHAGVTRIANIGERMLDAYATPAQLGQLGGMRVIETKMPELMFSQGAKLMTTRLI